MSLYERLKRGLQKENKLEAELAKAYEDGNAFFSQFNRNRMELAFSIFSDDMRKALFEVIFFLHVNEPKFEEHTFLTTRIERVHGVPKEVEYEAVTSLYVKDSPAGVVGIKELSPIFKDEFETFVQEELGSVVHEGSGFVPIYSIASLGSIGTVGHKETASDLDLQVQYELESFLYEPDQLSDIKLKAYANELIDVFSNKFKLIKRFTRKDLQDKEVISKIKIVGHKNFKKRFPLLYSYLFLKRIKSSVPLTSMRAFERRFLMS